MKKAASVVLGIDPGTSIIGYAAIERTPESASFLDAGAIRPATQNASLRLVEIHRAVARLIDIHRPKIIALEKVFFSKNIKTAFAVSEARGVILLTAALKKIRVCEYTPSEVKLAATGYGKADKQQVKEMMKLLLKTPGVSNLDDVTDAMAIAFTALSDNALKKNY